MKFSNQISAGNILAALAMLVAGLLAYASLVATQDAQQRRLDRIEASQQEREVRLRTLEVTIAGQASDLRSIQVGIGEIKAALDKLANGRIVP